jgi:6-phosphogluconolactonase (cycloisomerase 2 family)
MSLLRRALARSAVAGAAVAGVTLVLAPLSAGAHPPASHDAVYVLSNDPAGNAVLRFERQGDGSLVTAGSYPTGGTGTGAGLGSQGAVTVDDSGRYLYAVNPGSGSVSSFRVRRDGLQLIDVEPSGGTMPTSVTVHGHLVYVLNAGGPGSISGFTVRRGELAPLAASTRPLSSADTMPAQVSFTPDGDRLIVTERATQRFSVYRVDRHGRPVGPRIEASAGMTPFGFDFDNRDHLVVSEAAGGAADASTVSSYDVHRHRFEAVSAAVPTTETAACWIAITPNGRFAYSGNAASRSITGFAVGRRGDLRILDVHGATGSAAAAVTDLATSADGRFLYARLGDGTVGGWSIRRDGSLAPLGAFAGLPAGAAGIAAT